MRPTERYAFAACQGIMGNAAYIAKHLDTGNYFPSGVPAAHPTGTAAMTIELTAMRARIAQLEIAMHECPNCKNKVTPRQANAAST